MKMRREGQGEERRRTKMSREGQGGGENNIDAEKRTGRRGKGHRGGEKE